jgi:hypothetical protein
MPYQSKVTDLEGVVHWSEKYIWPELGKDLYLRVANARNRWKHNRLELRVLFGAPIRHFLECLFHCRTVIFGPWNNANISL